jgi:hypothetical protein
MSEVQSLRAFVDSISEGIATLLLGEDESLTVRVPVGWLPSEAKEGTVLRLRFDVDAAASEEGRQRVQSLLDSLPDQP